MKTLTEGGGGSSNTGQATIIAGPAGEKLVATSKGSYAQGDHALFEVDDNFIIVNVGWRRRDILPFAWTATRVSGEFVADGHLATDAPGWLQPAVTAALEKVQCYHCRETHYSL